MSKYKKIIIVTLLVFVLPIMASAATLDDLKTTLASLQIQLAAVALSQKSLDINPGLSAVSFVNTDNSSASSGLYKDQPFSIAWSCQSLSSNGLTIKIQKQGSFGSWDTIDTKTVQSACTDAVATNDNRQYTALSRTATGDKVRAIITGMFNGKTVTTTSDSVKYINTPCSVTKDCPALNVKISNTDATYTDGQTITADSSNNLQVWVTGKSAGCTVKTGNAVLKSGSGITASKVTDSIKMMCPGSKDQIVFVKFNFIVSGLTAIRNSGYAMGKYVDLGWKVVGGASPVVCAVNSSSAIGNADSQTGKTTSARVYGCKGYADGDACEGFTASVKCTEASGVTANLSFGPQNLTGLGAK